MVKCSAKKKDGKFCKANAVLEGLCLIHFKRGMPMGCKNCMELTDCKFLKMNDVFRCKKRRILSVKDHKILDKGVKERRGNRCLKK